MQDNGSPEGKREYPRHGVLALVRVRQIVNKGHSFVGKIYNVSPKGMYIETDAPLARGELFRADIIQSAEFFEGESMIGAAVWHRDIHDPNSGRFGYGVQYFRAPPSALLLSSVRRGGLVELPTGTRPDDSDDSEEWHALPA